VKKLLEENILPARSEMGAERKPKFSFSEKPRRVTC